MKIQPREILGLVATIRTLTPAQLVTIAHVSHISLRRSPDLYQFAEIALGDEAISHRLQHAPTQVLEALRSAKPMPSALVAAATELALAATYRDANGNQEVIPLQAVPALIADAQLEAEQPAEQVTVLSPTRAIQLADELVLELGRAPLPLTKNGHLAVADTKHLEERYGIGHPLIDAMCTVLVAAGLARRASTAMSLGSIPDNWASVDARVNTLRTAWMSSLPTALSKTVAAEPNLPIAEAVSKTYPIASPWRTEVSCRATVTAAALGSAGAPTLEPRLDEVTSVYIQPDGSVIAPGPLSVSARSAVQMFAQLDHLDDASTFRVTEQAIATAIHAGHTSTEITQAASTVSATEVPAAVTRLISETARKLAQITVTPVDGGTKIVASTTELADVLAHDRMLKEFQLRKDGTTLTTTFAFTPVYHALVERRYLPASVASKAREITEPAHTDLQLAAAKELLAGVANDNSIESELRLAIKLRIPLRLSMQLRNGNIQEFNIQPVNVANGRLAAVDPVAEVERTLPLNRITKLEFALESEGVPAR